MLVPEGGSSNGVGIEDKNGQATRDDKAGPSARCAPPSASGRRGLKRDNSSNILLNRTDSTSSSSSLSEVTADVKPIVDAGTGVYCVCMRIVSVIESLLNV